MAIDKKGKEALKALLPNAVEIKIDGMDVRVATNKSENQIMNMMLASQMRSLIHQTIKNYKDDEVKLSPKELKDLSDAARNVAQFSAEIYLDPAADIKPPERNAEKPDDIDFSKLKPINVETEEKKDEAP